MFAPFIKGILLGLMLAISMGPVIFSIIKISVSNGHKWGIGFVSGVSASDITIVLISQLFTELFKNILAYKKEIGFLGSALLVVIGLFIILFKKEEAVSQGDKLIAPMRKIDFIKIFFSGYFMNILNPSVIGFWLLIATAVLSDSLTYRIIMFTTCLGFNLIMDITKVFIASKLRQKLTAHNIHIINQISGVILLCFGIGIFIGLLKFGSAF